MAFYNGYSNPNYGAYPAYNPYQQQYAQPQVQQPMPQMQPTQMSGANQQFQPIGGNGIIWVSGYDEAARYPVAPNAAVTLWSQTEPFVYLKKADASGKPTITIYELVERNAPTAHENKAENKADNLATKEELAAVVQAVKSIDAVVGNIKSDVDTLRGDMYGIAGKKKSAPKAKETEVDE